MKFSLAPLFLLAAAASALPSAAPVADSTEVAAPSTPLYFDEFIAAVEETNAAFSSHETVEKRDLTKSQCKAACKGGAEAMERICRLIPAPPVKAICWGIAAGVQTKAGLSACTAFCDWAV
ncbi:hypothetical protein BJ508DRAFT_416193 [Ascobolus immersus RN42]|uniref:Fungal calcium binding protein domain-containing protein n=1 Tax=Ascobolus immersus RN42 TaxID=1160509 RepID=A0A3N4I4M5_ASCIM|nr:hypothetical protein BJ508DRAFT_416193 [Ascobolus immersus RN42]